MKDFFNEEMEIKERFITIGEFVKGYVNNDETDEGGVFTMNNTVCIRPYFQRSYIRANDKAWKQNLIYSILRGYPISLIYLGANEDGTYDMIDGQQRSITICDFVNHAFSIEIDNKVYNYGNLPQIYKDKFDSYKLRINDCIGNEATKLKWFEIINQPISELEQQELRNAVYPGEWLEKNKKYFSAPTSKITKEVNDKSHNNRYAAYRYCANPQIERQDILQLALDWASASEFPDMIDEDTQKRAMHKRIELYMTKHQHDSDNTLIDFYKNVIDWIWATFLDLDNNPHSSRNIKGTPHSMENVDWGRLYYLYHDKYYDTKYLSKRVIELISDNDIQQKKGIYEYLLTGEKNEKYLQIRKFSNEEKEQMYHYQGGIDPIDGKHYLLDEMETHHIKAWSNGGRTVIDNCVLLSPQNHIDFHNHCIETNELIRRRDELWKKNNPKEYDKYIWRKKGEEEIEKKYKNN